MIPIQDSLLSLPNVVTRRMNTRHGYFTAGRMFALVGKSMLWLRLPAPATAPLVQADRAVPLVDAAIPAVLSWVAVPPDSLEPAELHDLVLASHQAVRSTRRSRRPRSGPRARRRRTTA